MTERLPIWRDANRLLLGVEQAVRGFGRYHKYSLGGDLRRQALRVCQYLARALSAQGPERPPRVRRFLQALFDRYPWLALLFRRHRLIPLATVQTPHPGSRTRGEGVVATEPLSRFPRPSWEGARGREHLLPLWEPRG